MSMRLIPGISRDNLKLLYADPLIQRIGTDARPAAPLVHPLLRYISVLDGEEFMGAYIMIDFSPHERELHMLLHRKATGISRQASRAALDLAFEDPGVSRVTAWVLATIPTAVNHCRRLGFSIEGIKREAVVIGGCLTDIVLLGITRVEWERTA